MSVNKASTERQQSLKGKNLNSVRYKARVPLLKLLRHRYTPLGAPLFFEGLAKTSGVALATNGFEF